MNVPVYAICFVMLCLSTSVNYAQEIKYLGKFEHRTDQPGMRANVFADFSHDEKFVASRLEGNSIKIWETETGKLVREINNPRGSNNTPREPVRFSPDGKFLVGPGDEKTLMVWDANTYTLLQELEGPLSSQFSSTGKYLITELYSKGGRTPQCKTTVWETGTWRNIHSFTYPYSGNTQRKFSPDEKYLVVAQSGKDIKILETTTGKVIANLIGHNPSGVVTSVSFSADSKYIVTAAADGVKIWHINGKLARTLEGNDARNSAAFSPDGNYVVTGGSTARLFETKTGLRLREFSEISALVQFSPDGKYIMSNRRPGVWEASTGRKVEFSESWESFFKWSPRGTYLLSTYSFIVKIWKVTTEVNAPRPKAPANLEIKSLTLAEQSDNGNLMLDASEKASISFTVSNVGKGHAYNVIAQIKALTPAVGVDFPKQHHIGTLDAGSTKDIRIPISAEHGVGSASVQFEILLKEGNGFDADPVVLSFNTQSFKNPVLAIADHKFSTDQGGKIKLGQSTSLEIIVQNKGQGDATNVKVSFNNPANIFPGSENSFVIDKLEPNATKKLTYEFFANKSYTAKEIAIDVIITEHYNQYGERRTLTVSLDQNLTKTKMVEIAGKTDGPVKIDNVFLDTDTEPKAISDADVEKADTPTGVPVFYSLFIGVNKYQFASYTLSNLNKPISDATALRNVLLTNYAFPAENSFLLQNPTRAEILNMLESLSEKITTKDNLLIFYAGHGHWDDRMKIGYWLPSDSKSNDKSNWIANSTIRDYIAGIQSKHTLLITDACFSGGIFKTREMGTEISDHAIANIYRMPSRKAMTSGTLTVVPDESKFMEYLVKRLAENTNKYLTAQQLFYSLETAVLNNTSTVPQFGVIQETGDEGGAFIFIRR